MNVKRYDALEWKEHSENAHRAVFHKHKPSHFDRIDYALVAGDDLVPWCYVTCREVDHETVYWQFGGAFPQARSTLKAVRSVQAFMRYSCERYKRVTFLVENTNRQMLKMANGLGFLISGVRFFDGKVLVEHYKEL